MPTDIDANRLFVPSKAIRKEKEFFAGRRELILDALDEFETPGRSLVVFGDRGVGKTSVAWQIYELLSGDRTLLDQWGIEGFLTEGRYKCIWLQCERNMTSIEGAILRSFLRSPDGPTFFDQFPKVFQKKRILESSKKKFNIDLKVIGFELENLTKPGNTADEYSQALLEKEASIRALFGEVLAEIKNEKEYSDSEIVIFFDELDVLPIKRGIGSLIKEINSARFAIVGVFDNLEEVVADHPSVERKLGTCEVPGLSAVDINWIYDRAENVYKGRLNFTPEFRSFVIDKAHGFPWLVQSFGHAAVKGALRSQRSKTGKLIVAPEHLKTSIDQLIKRRKEQRAYSSLREILESDQVAQHEILWLAAVSPRTMTVPDVIDHIQGPTKRWVEKNVEDLVLASILKKDTHRRVRFEDPIARIIVQLHFESIGSAPSTNVVPPR